MDIGLVLDKIRPGAAYRMYDTYENLVATWEDAVQHCPTIEEIKVAWEVIYKEQLLASLDSEYQPQFAELSRALGLASLAENQLGIQAIKEDYNTLLAEYNDKRGAING